MPWDHWFVRKLADPLVLFGLAGQLVFMLRFLVQWWASERRGRSYVPVAFWYFSVAGGIMLLIYGLRDRDPVIIVGQALGLAIYLRNLILIHTRYARYHHRRAVRPPDASGTVRSQPPAMPGGPLSPVTASADELSGSA